VHAFRVESFLVCHFEQLRQNVATHFRSTGLPGNPEAVTAACDFDVEAAFDLPQVFIKLTAEIGEAVVIGGLENYVPRNLDSIQSLYL